MNTENTEASGLREPAPPAIPWVEELADRLARELRELVLPSLGQASARGLAGTAVGGDTTFAVDEIAESYVVDFLARESLPVALYSEDRGLMTSGDPDYVLVVDPIDGTRPAAAGFEAACVSIAVAQWGGDPTMGDVFYGVLQEIKEGGVFSARRGGGVRAQNLLGRDIDIHLSQNADLSRLFWTIGFRGRPAVELSTVLGGLIDESSVDGAVFDLGSATYCMSRILTGQLDAYVDVGPLMIEYVPEVEKRFREVGNGHVLNNAPYDVAASTLILEEAGCVVTDAAGRPLDGRPLLGSGVDHQMSVVASANSSIHQRILEQIERGLVSLRGYVT